jgi:hypothetical protein
MVSCAVCQIDSSSGSDWSPRGSIAFKQGSFTRHPGLEPDP